MMKILIVEDEMPAYNRLVKIVNELLPDTEIVGHVDSIESGVAWFEKNDEPDLMLIDIHLADGSGFELISQVSPKCPYIFTTAYDQYAIEAFKTNGSGYVLKPVKKEELLFAVHKAMQLKVQPVDVSTEDAGRGKYKSRFMVRFGETIKALQVCDIAYCYSESKATFARSFNGQTWPMDHNLDALESMLDPKMFFRINRQYLVSFRSIDEMKIYTKSRILIKLNPPVKELPVVSSERSADFKQWLDDAV